LSVKHGTVFKCQNRFHQNQQMLGEPRKNGKKFQPRTCPPSCPS
jgi:hypothetical protein